MNVPTPLEKNDAIGIVAPSGKIEPYLIDFAENVIHNHGFKAVKGANVYKSFYKFAGTDQQRLSDLQHMLDDPDIKAIWCARGGYGLSRICDRLELTAFKNCPKWIIGFSDATILHSLVHTFTGTVSIHGEMPLHFPELVKDNDNPSLSTIFNMLRGEVPMYTFEQHSFNKTGTREGILVGGNLSVMAGMRGSPLEVDFDGAILFVEDTGEFLYHVDRMMMNLWHGGILHKISGLVVGGMDDMKEADKEFGASAYELIHEKVKDLEIPVAYGFPAGHRKVNLPLLMGHPVKLSTAGPKACLDFSQSTGLEIPV